MGANPVPRDGRTPGIVEAMQHQWVAAADELLATAPQADLPARAVRSVSSLPGAHVLLVDEGFVVVRATDPASGRGVIVCHGGAGTVLPFLADTHEIVALVDSRLTVITVDAYEGVLELPDAARALFSGLEAIARQQHRTMVALARSHHVDRLREKLLQLAEAHGRVTRDGVVLQLPITHEVLAEMIGSARETVTRGMDALEETGFLHRHDRGYALHVSPGALDG
jgi:CRP-like cAMP-binding protein